MPNLKDLRVRIDSVKSTQKITSAMKMVAAAKLRRAQESAEAARPYAERMEQMLGSLAASLGGIEGAPRLLAGTGTDQTHLLVAFTANRGLCGGFNSSVVRRVREITNDLRNQGRTVKILCVGRKGHDVLKREFPDEIGESIEDIGKRYGVYHEAIDVSSRIMELFDAGEFDICTIIFNRFPKFHMDMLIFMGGNVFSYKICPDG